MVSATEKVRSFWQRLTGRQPKAEATVPRGVELLAEFAVTMLTDKSLRDWDAAPKPPLDTNFSVPNMMLNDTDHECVIKATGFLDNTLAERVKQEQQKQSQPTKPKREDLYNRMDCLRKLNLIEPWVADTLNEIRKLRFDPAHGFVTFTFTEGNLAPVKAAMGTRWPTIEKYAALMRELALQVEKKRAALKQQLRELGEDPDKMDLPKEPPVPTPLRMEFCWIVTELLRNIRV